MSVVSYFPYHVGLRSFLVTLILGVQYLSVHYSKENTLVNYFRFHCDVVAAVDCWLGLWLWLASRVGRGITLVWKVGDQARGDRGGGDRDTEDVEGMGMWRTFLPIGGLGGLGSVVSSPSRVRGFLELSKHVWTHIANFGQSCMNTF